MTREQILQEGANELNRVGREGPALSVLRTPESTKQSKIFWNLTVQLWMTAVRYIQSGSRKRLSVLSMLGLLPSISWHNGSCEILKKTTRFMVHIRPIWMDWMKTR